MDEVVDEENPSLSLPFDEGRGAP